MVIVQIKPFAFKLPYSYIYFTISKILNNMTDLIEEVSADIKAEQFFAAVKKFGKMFAIGAIIVIVVTSIVVFRNYKHEQKQLAFSLDYYKLINMKPDSNEAQQLLSIITKGNSEAFAPMANLFYAKKLIANKEDQKAYQILASIYDDEKNDITFRNLAKILALSLALEKGNKDFSIQVQTNNKQPFNSLLAISYSEYLLQIGKKDEARSMLKDLTADKSNQDNMQYLANILLHSIGEKHA